MNTFSKSLSSVDQLTQRSTAQFSNPVIRTQSNPNIPRSAPLSPTVSVSQVAANFVNRFSETFKKSSKIVPSNKKTPSFVSQIIPNRAQQPIQNNNCKKLDPIYLEKMIKNFVETYLDNCKSFPDFAKQRKPLLISLFHELNKINENLDNEENEKLIFSKVIKTKQETIFRLASNAYVNKAISDYIEYLGDKVTGHQSPYALYLLLKPLISALKTSLKFDFPSISTSSYQIRDYISKLVIYRSILKTHVLSPIKYNRNLLVENKLGGQHSIYKYSQNESGEIIHKQVYQIGTVEKVFLAPKDIQEIDNEIKKEIKKSIPINLRIQV